MAPSEHELDAPPWLRVESTLMATARAIRVAYDQRLAVYELNLSQASVLAYLNESGPLTQTQLPISSASVGRRRAPSSTLSNSAGSCSDSPIPEIVGSG